MRAELTRGLRQRQLHGEGRALAQHAFDGQAAAVAVEDVLDQREAEAGAALGAALARRRPDRTARSGAADARARCRDRSRAPRCAPRARRPTRSCSVDFDPLAGGAVFERVLDQVLEHPEQFVAVAEHLHGLGRRVNLDRPHRDRAPASAGRRRPGARWRRDRACVSGRRWALSSMRESDSRSSIRRAMRVACACMMPRKRSRAAGSSRAGPCSVSMKPESAASGVRSSWLALATKSARISSTRRSGERS